MIIKVSPHGRSAAYPSVSIKESIDFSGQIYENFGTKSFTKEEDISTVLKKSYSTLKPKYSSACQYGLLELKYKLGYKPSQAYLDIRNPRSEAEERATLLKCFQSPPLYRKLIEKYDNGIIPVKIGLRAYLIKDFGITESAVDACLEVFFDNAISLKVMNEERYFSINSVLSNNSFAIGEQEKQEEGKPPSPEGNLTVIPIPEVIIPKVELLNKKNSLEYREIPIFLDENRTIYVQIPHEFYEEDFLYLKEVLDVNLRRVIKKANTNPH